AWRPGFLERDPLGAKYAEPRLRDETVLQAVGGGRTLHRQVIGGGKGETLSGVTAHGMTGRFRIAEAPPPSCLRQSVVQRESSAGSRTDAGCGSSAARGPKSRSPRGGPATKLPAAVMAAVPGRRNR